MCVYIIYIYIYICIDMIVYIYIYIYVCHISGNSSTSNKTSKTTSKYLEITGKPGQLLPKVLESTAAQRHQATP